MIRIFIVEDDTSLQNLYEIILSSSGFEIMDIANNGEEAVQLFKAAPKKPDIIIMDHRMPIKNGIEATREIMSLDNHIKIIFASADISVKDEALSMGVTCFLEKPFSVKFLVTEIERIAAQLVNAL